MSKGHAAFKIAEETLVELAMKLPLDNHDVLGGFVGALTRALAVTICANAGQATEDTLCNRLRETINTFLLETQNEIAQQGTVCGGSGQVDRSDSPNDSEGQARETGSAATGTDCVNGDTDDSGYYRAGRPSLN